MTDYFHRLLQRSPHPRPTGMTGTASVVPALTPAVSLVQTAAGQDRQDAVDDPFEAADRDTFPAVASTFGTPLLASPQGNAQTRSMSRRAARSAAPLTGESHAPLSPTPFTPSPASGMTAAVSVDSAVSPLSSALRTGQHEEKSAAPTSSAEPQSQAREKEARVSAAPPTPTGEPNAPTGP